MAGFKWCPRCKQDRMIEWFGEPQAPYAICLACRVELNGEEKTKRQEHIRQRFVKLCPVCDVALPSNEELCDRCTVAARIWNSARLLGRAQAFITGNLRHPRKQPKKHKRKNQRLRELVESQRQDGRDRNIRFDHAVNK